MGEPKPGETSARIRLLLVDDDEHYRKMLGAHLKADGFAVTVAADGRGAVVLAQAQEFDLILMDVVMPNQGGYASYRALRALPRAKSTPVILLTGIAQPGHWEPVPDEGETRAFFMGKPFEHARLLERIAWLLSNEGAREGP